MKKWMCLLVCLLMIGSSCMTATAAPEDLPEHAVTMEPEKNENGEIVVLIYDEENGASIPGWIVYLEVGGERVDTYTVGGDSTVMIDYEFPAEQVKVECRSYEGPCADTVYYTESVVDITTLVYDGQAAVTETTTAPAEETTTTESVETTTSSTEGGETTVPPATETTVPQSTTDGLSFAPFTTAVADDGRVAIGIDVDNSLVNATQMQAEDFVMESRLWMQASQYSTLVSTADGTLHLELTLNGNAGSKSKLIAAKNADENYASFADSEVNGFAMNMVLKYVDDDVRQPLDVADSEYELEMVLPESLKDCEKLAVAICTIDGLDKFYEVIPNNGMINIRFQRFQTLAIVGFGNGASEGWNLLVVILVIGGVLIVAGIVILLLVTFRRKKKEDKNEPETKDKDSMKIVPETAIDELITGFDEDEDMTVIPVQTPEREKEITDFERIAVQTVSPAKPIARAPRTTSAKPERTSFADISVDDLLDELTRDLDDLGGE